LLFQDQEVFTWGRFLSRLEIRVAALRQDQEALHRNGPIVQIKKLVTKRFGIYPICVCFHFLVGTSKVLDIWCHKSLRGVLKEQAAVLLI